MIIVCIKNLPFLGARVKMAAMFLMLSGFWIAALGWVGFRAGHAIQDMAEYTKGGSQAGGKGASVMTDAGESGGAIKLVRKRPAADFQAHVEAQLGSWDGKHVAGNISGQQVEPDAIRERLVAVVDRSDSFVDHMHEF
ncbi:hypothetical protein [Thauera sp. SDU_THAU2]|uniref:hypothetical protein n=1 Tax=Thauera sp. SDU_THAU2 TaxID=3136633 RepID=UPI00311F2E91